MARNKKIMFIGAGNMAQSIISGLLKENFSSSDIFAVDTDEAQRNHIEKTFAIQTSNDLSVIKSADVIIVSTKPQHVQGICSHVKDFVKNQLIISIAAGIRLNQISQWLGGYQKIIRTMPNLVAQVQKSVTVAFTLPETDQESVEDTSKILNSFGDTIWLKEERLIDSATALSGSGPAYIFYFLNALIQSGINIGLEKKDAQILALKTFQGSSVLAEKYINDLEMLIKNVTSKGGTTEQALKVLDEKDLKEIIDSAIKAAFARAQEMGEK
jgi:pyrroline-5-carboxylate reductase